MAIFPDQRQLEISAVERLQIGTVVIPLQHTWKFAYLVAVYASKPQFERMTCLQCIVWPQFSRDVGCSLGLKVFKSI